MVRRLTDDEIRIGIVQNSFSYQECEKIIERKERELRHLLEIYTTVEDAAVIMARVGDLIEICVAQAKLGV